MQERLRSARLGVAAIALAAAAQLACGTSDRQAKNSGTHADDRQSAAGAGHAPEDIVNLTGCMERGTIPGSFVLTHTSTARNVPGRTDETTGTSGSSGENSGAGAGGASSADTYTVTSGDGTDLGAFVGKRVTVTGRFATSGHEQGNGTTANGTVASPGQTAGPDAAPGTPGVPGSRASAPGTTGTGASAAAADSTAATRGPSVVPTRQLTSTDVRQVAGSCAPSANR